VEQRKWLALAGIVSAVLLPLAIIVIAGSTPNDHASASKVMSFYSDNRGRNNLAAILVVIAAVLLVLFAAQLRQALGGDHPAVLPRAAFGGLLVTAAGAGISAAVHLALVDAVHYHLTSAAVTLNVLDNYAPVAIVTGFAAFGLAAGFSTLQRPAIPKWLGWAAIVFGVLSFLGPIGFIGLLLGLIWIIVVGVLLFRRDLQPAA